MFPEVVVVKELLWFQSLNQPTTRNFYVSCCSTLKMHHQMKTFGLTSAALLFNYFRQCLRGEARVNWDTTRRGIVVNLVGFNTVKTTFIATYFMPNDLADQIHWLQEQSMPQNMTVASFVSRVVDGRTVERCTPWVPRLTLLLTLIEYV